MENKILEKSKWIFTPAEIEAPVILRTVFANSPTDASMTLATLGFHILYVNGCRVGDAYFRPSNSVYRERELKTATYPVKDKFTYRTYCTVYDIGEYLKDGENKIEIMIGGGWYRQTERTAEGDMSFGDRLGAIYSIRMSGSDGEFEIYSDGTELCRTSEIIYSNLFHGETVDLRKRVHPVQRFSRVSTAEVDTKLTYDDAPPDRVIRRIKPILIYEDEAKRIYDSGENISGFAVLRAYGDLGEHITVRYAENIDGDKLDFLSTGSSYVSKSGKRQIMQDEFITAGENELLEPHFVWHAFRYFEVTGNAECECVKVIHSDCCVTGSFSSSSRELNWLCDAYLRTQLSNMHCGVPSDCPHRERLGYTGDGQVTAPAAMLMLDARDFYRKWIRDIFDSQDRESGHVNHTAPFAGGGGGPGGWGMAAITVPYNYYKIYGDIAPAKENYQRMKRWVKYLIRHTLDGIIVSEEEGGWCLGDWCTLGETLIPEPYVNTCLFIRALSMLRELASALGHDSDLEWIDSVASRASFAIVRKYFDNVTGSFAGGVQGADAYALEVGLGNCKTLENLKRKYEELGHFDTGFLGTDILCEVLFNNGCEDLAYKLLTSHEAGGYGKFMIDGFTTLPESWVGDGSHSHPMFGAPVRQLFEAVLGIKNRGGSCGFADVLISPRIPKTLDKASGEIMTKQGILRLEFERVNGEESFTIEIPKGIRAAFSLGDREIKLSYGINRI